ncbi:MAG: DM13 domain-containing protein [Actinomycetota bacterium]
MTSGRGARSLLLLALALVASACGREGTQRSTNPPAAFPSALPSVPQVLTAGEQERAAPRWEQVKVLTGTGPVDADPFSIAPRALQWRVKWECEKGALTIKMTPPPSKGGPLLSSPCPKDGEAFSVNTGEVRLSIDASAKWTATVEQQVDTPLNEPALPEMANAPVLLKGTFYDVEKKGKGTITLYRLPNGQRALRFSEDFEVTNDISLVIWLSEVPNPKNSKEVVDSPHVEIAALKSTRGSQNYIVPADVPTNKIRSVALYCVPVPSIYTAAALS